jgi:TPR repeat protein
MARLRRRLSLDPEIVPEPPIRIGPWLSPVQIALRLAAVAGVASLIAWTVISLANKPAADDVAQSAVNDATQSAAAPALTSIPVKLVNVSVATESPHVTTETPPAPAAMEAPPAVPAVLVAKTEEPQPEATPPPPVQQEPSAAALAPSTSVALAPEEIAMLVKRGKDQLTNGDISSARLLLRRAADAGNADAALALGSTFDPLVLAHLGAVGVQADTAKARQWYQEAAQFGSDAAAQHLATLARADQ